MIKDVIHTVYSYLTSGESVLPKNSNVRYIFLVRDPHSALVSLSNFVGELPTSPPGLISYGMLYSLYEYLKENAVNEPLVVDADAFFKNFPSELSLLFNSINTLLSNDFTKEPTLSSLRMEQAIEKWHDPSKTKTFTEWHDKAAESKEILSLPTYKIENGKPTFEEIPKDNREAYREAYETNIRYYLLFLKLSNIWK